MPRYTPSKDGVMRANVTVKLRFDPETFGTLKRLAKHRKLDLVEMLEAEALLSIEGLLARAICDNEFGEF